MSRHQSLVQERSVSKRIIASFYNKTGHVAIVALENCRTVNSDWYTTICLSEVIDKLCKNNYKHRIILYHDNNINYTAKWTYKFLKEENLEHVRIPADPTSNEIQSISSDQTNTLLVEMKKGSWER
ncbi:hypothetical protein EVAR_100621_1 [Eumeta japonica]|uniref:Mariner Mos1 transposase n=1 Tax=Eumeta variegata TaxID=151549 RepID=A0A4C1ZBZ4_EUMVA|nr:hypothetical protein EVAR_100621_1 [Eumeta japonica]